MAILAIFIPIFIWQWIRNDDEDVLYGQLFMMSCCLPGFYGAIMMNGGEHGIWPILATAGGGAFAVLVSGFGESGRIAKFATSVTMGSLMGVESQEERDAIRSKLKTWRLSYWPNFVVWAILFAVNIVIMSAYYNMSL